MFGVIYSKKLRVYLIPLHAIYSFLVLLVIYLAMKVSFINPVDNTVL